MGCSSSRQGPSSTTVDSTEDVTTTTNITIAPVTTIATRTTLALDEFDTSLFADTHIEFVRDAMSVNTSNDVTDEAIIGAARNVCNEVRTRGLTKWLKEVDSHYDTDSSEEWSIRFRSTFGAIRWLCSEFKDAFFKHPIPNSRW